MLRSEVGWSGVMMLDGECDDVGGECDDVDDESEGDDDGMCVGW